MNITELARILKVSPFELRQLLPQMGFNIGNKAIKVDKMIAKKIIRGWPVLWPRLSDSEKWRRKLKRARSFS